MSTAVSIEDLTFAYKGQEIPALCSVAGDLEAGSLVALLGHAGAGKSTLCASLNGIVPHFFRGKYQGRVTVKGLEVARRKVSEISRTVGLVLQDFEPQLFSTNVELEMAFGPENLCLERAEIERRIRQTLPFLGLEDLRGREPATLSGGQKQRLAISSVLTMGPDVLVMDEPTTDLDPEAREEVNSIGRRLREEGRTLLIADYDPDAAEKADRIWLMSAGRMIDQGKPAEILTNPAALKSCGVRVPAILELFQKMDWPGKPFTADQAKTLIEQNGLGRRRKFQAGAAVQGQSGGFVLETHDLGYTYPTHRVQALRGIHLQVREGEFLALLGQNGSGKTTLAKHFNALLKPSSGRVLLKGRPLPKYTPKEISRIVGYVFQNPDHQIFCNTVYEEVALGLKCQGETAGIIKTRVEEALQTVGLGGYELEVPFALTKGERQRVAAASVLAVRPEILILDEPTTGLDESNQRSFMNTLKELNRRGHTIVIITHSMDVAAEYADRVVVMKGGAILLEGPTRDVFAREEKLREASLRPPPVVQLSNWLGTQALTVDQMVQEFGG